MKSGHPPAGINPFDGTSPEAENVAPTQVLNLLLLQSWPNVIWRGSAVQPGCCRRQQGGFRVMASGSVSVNQLGSNRWMARTTGTFRCGSLTPFL